MTRFVNIAKHFKHNLRGFNNWQKTTCFCQILNSSKFCNLNICVWAIFLQTLFFWHCYQWLELNKSDFVNFVSWIFVSGQFSLTRFSFDIVLAMVKTKQIRIWFQLLRFPLSSNIWKTHTTETDKEVYRQELLNQPMRVQIAGLPRTVIISLPE